MTEFYPYIYDLLIVAATVIFLLVGRRYGAARMLFLVAGTLCALIAASVLSSASAQLFFDSFMRARLVESVRQALPDSSTLTELLRKLSSDSTLAAGILLLLGLSSDELSQFDTIISNAAGSAAQTVVNELLAPLVISLLRSIAFIIIFIILSVIVKLIAKSLGLVNKAPVIGGANRFLGAVLGALFGLLAVVAATVPLCILLRYSASDGFLSESVVRRSLIYRYIYDLVSSTLFK